MSLALSLGVVVLAAVGAVFAFPLLRSVVRSSSFQWHFGWFRSKVQPHLSALTLPWNAHEIHPNVWLGDLPSACNLARLEAVGVSHVLAVMAGLSPPFPARFNYSVVHVRDVPEEDLLSHLPATTAFIDNALSQGGVVYVHCAAGVSRSATVVTAWLMRRLQLGHAEALSRLQERRSVVQPNSGFVEQLKRWETHR